MFKEIVTKAVIGKGKKTFKNTYNMLIENNADTVLGCWVINHNFKGYESNGTIIIDGSFDVNIWYSYENDTKTAVSNKNIKYFEKLKMNTKEGTSVIGSDIIVRALKQPNCVNVNIKDDVVEFDIEKELGIEIVNDTKVKIAIEEDEEPWDIIEDSKEDIEKKIDEEVKEDFI